MIYLIDGNNLSGKLKTLGRENHDRRLVSRLQEFNKAHNYEIKLVFDGDEPMGDKISVDRHITVIRSPRDKYYKNADDYIVDLASRLEGKVTVVTDDRELRRRLDRLQEQTMTQIFLVRATDLAARLCGKNQAEEAEAQAEEELSREEQERITEELKNIWQ